MAEPQTKFSKPGDELEMERELVEDQVDNNALVREALEELRALVETRARNQSAIEHLSRRSGLLSRLGVYTSV